MKRTAKILTWIAAGMALRLAIRTWANSVAMKRTKRIINETWGKAGVSER